MQGYWCRLILYLIPANGWMAFRLKLFESDVCDRWIITIRYGSVTCGLAGAARCVGIFPEIQNFPRPRLIRLQLFRKMKPFLFAWLKGSEAFCLGGCASYMTTISVLGIGYFYLFDKVDIKSICASCLTRPAWGTSTKEYSERWYQIGSPGAAKPRSVYRLCVSTFVHLLQYIIYHFQLKNDLTTYFSYRFQACITEFRHGIDQTISHVRHNQFQQIQQPFSRNIKVVDEIRSASAPFCLFMYLTSFTKYICADFPLFQQAS